MLPLADNMTADDINQWLRNGWFLAEVKGKYKTCMLYDIADRRNLIVQDTEGYRYKVRSSDVSAHWPMCGAINVGPFALYVQRMQSRVYRRTYQADLVSIHVVRPWDSRERFPVQYKKLSRRANDPKIVKELFTPSYCTYKEALADLESGKAVARALNAHVVLASPNKKGDELYVYNRNVIAGKIINGDYRPLSSGPGDSRRIHKLFREV